ncbi:hypothetical protein WMF30_44450 [Sorangium sp. So ce134]
MSLAPNDDADAAGAAAAGILVFLLLRPGAEEPSRTQGVIWAVEDGQTFCCKRAGG